MNLDDAISISDLTGGQTKELDLFIDLQTKLFPQDTRYVPIMRQRALNPADSDPRFVQHQWLIKYLDEPIGMTIFKYARMRNCGIGLDIGISPAARQSGQGKSGRLSEWITERCLDQLQVDAGRYQNPQPLGLAVEVESKRLVQRFVQYGFVELPVEYHEPPFIQHQLSFVSDEDSERIDFRPMHLGIFPYPGVNLNPADPDTQVQIVMAFLVDHYGLAANHWAVRRALNSDH